MVCLITACTKSQDEASADLWPTLPDTAPPDMAVPDQKPPDCSIPSGDAANAGGWRVVWSAEVPLHDIVCVKDHIFIAGEKATLLHHKPQSPHCSGFVKQKVPTTVDLLTVSFADLTYGVTAGRAKEIWETHDQGESWTIAPQCGETVFKTYHSLHLYEPQKGYGVGETANQDGAYKVYPQGVNKWICTGNNFNKSVLYGVFRLEDKGWFVGDTNGRIYHTTDEGTTWYYDDTTSHKPLRSVAITSKSIGIVVGDEGVILRSEDSLSWTQVRTLGTADLREAYFFDDNNGWIVGASGTIMSTTDAGKTWIPQNVTTTATIEGVCFTSATTGWAITDKGEVLYTTTGGK